MQESLVQGSISNDEVSKTHQAGTQRSDIHMNIQILGD